VKARHAGTREAIAEAPNHFEIPQYPKKNIDYREENVRKTKSLPLVLREVLEKHTIMLTSAARFTYRM
jgi:hypothetical protein